MPIRDEWILVGRRRTLLENRLPAAIRIHGIEALRLGSEASAALASAQPDHFVLRSDVKGVLMDG